MRGGKSSSGSLSRPGRLWPRSRWRASRPRTGRILSIDQWRLRGREGIEIKRELPTLYTFRDALIVQIDGFTEKADALEAAGLRE
jgi:hypothetical protein